MSYGKDSIACLYAIRELGWPLDRIVHAEVYATDDIPADLPPMVEFKKVADEIIKREFGIQVEHLYATRNGEKLTYEKLFYHVPKRKTQDFSKKNLERRGLTVGNDAEGDAEQQVCSNEMPCGFPFTVSSWRKKLKDGTYPRLSDGQRELVYQRPQAPGFPPAPLHEGRRKIS